MGQVLELALLERVTVATATETLPLTEKQEKLWRFIESCQRSPTYDEMRAHMGLASKTGICRLIDALHSRGFVTYHPHRPRTVIALDPRARLTAFKTTDLIAELERRGVNLEARL